MQMENLSKEDLIKDLENNIYCRLKSSPIQGIGVFAIRDIPKGTNPFIGFREINYIEIPVEEIFSNNKISDEVKNLVTDLYAVQNGQISLPNHSLNEVDIGYFMNHSETPNMEAIESGSAFVAKKDIKKGEELTSDYRTYSDPD